MYTRSVLITILVGVLITQWIAASSSSSSISSEASSNSSSSSSGESRRKRSSEASSNSSSISAEAPSNSSSSSSGESRSKRSSSSNSSPISAEVSSNSSSSSSGESRRKRSPEVSPNNLSGSTEEAKQSGFYCAPNDPGHLPINRICDGINDCTNMADEASCNTKICSNPGTFYCSISNTCKPVNLFCNGEIDCVTDEHNCLVF